MKKKVLSVVIVMILVLSPIIGQEDYKQLYEHKVHTYTRMKHAGWVMTGIGSGFATAGTLILATVPGSNWSDQDQTESIADVLQALTGIVCLTVGVGLLAGGLTLGSIGTHKVKSYQNKLDKLSLGLICTPNKQGFTLTYRF